MVAAGTVPDVPTAEDVSAAFDHPINVDHRDGRWSARAVRPSRAH